MEGLLYFPYIEVPENDWLIRTLLYWDKVGTIWATEGPWVYEEDSLSNRLMRAELLVAAFPVDADRNRSHLFIKHLRSLDEEELDRRKREFRAGNRTMVHEQKVQYSDGYEWVESLGLAGKTDRFQDPDQLFVQMEKRTASEFMASLALALSHPQSDFGEEGDRWTPGTDQPVNLLTLLGGPAHFGDTESGDPNDIDKAHESRVRLQEREKGLRAVVLRSLFPVPAEQEMPSVEDLTSFKRDFGEQLVRFRRTVEDRVIDALRSDDPDLQRRQIDNLSSEVEDEVRKVEASLLKLKVGRVTRSTPVQLFRMLSGSFDRSAARAEEMVSGETGPLAYAAFARHRLFQERQAPFAMPVFAESDHLLVEQFGYNSPR